MQNTINSNYSDLIVNGAITENVKIFGANLERGSVLASYGVASAAVKAKKSVTFTGTPVASKSVKVKIDGVEVSYTTTSTTLATEVAGIAAAINADDTLGELVTAASSSGTLTIESDVAGYDGNGMKIEVTVGEGAGVTAGAVTVAVIGRDKDDELFTIVDSDNANSALQKPVAVLLEDAKDGEARVAAFFGVANAAKLKFSTGDSLATFKVELRKIGIYPQTFR